MWLDTCCLWLRGRSSYDRACCVWEYGLVGFLLCSEFLLNWLFSEPLLRPILKFIIDVQVHKLDFSGFGYPTLWCHDEVFSSYLPVSGNLSKSLFVTDNVVLKLVNDRVSCLLRENWLVLQFDCVCAVHIVYCYMPHAVPLLHSLILLCFEVLDEALDML